HRPQVGDEGVAEQPGGTVHMDCEPRGLQGGCDGCEMRAFAAQHGLRRPFGDGGEPFGEGSQAVGEEVGVGCARADLDAHLPVAGSVAAVSGLSLLSVSPSAMRLATCRIDRSLRQLVLSVSDSTSVKSEEKRLILSA